jgi:DNA-binding transcriptional MocR family regulator
VLFELNRENHIPLYAQIVVQVRDMINKGALRVGDRLPANRELAKSLGVNRTTVSTAYAELAADGLITSQVGRGTFISGVPAIRARREDRAQPPSMPWAALLTEQRRENWLDGMLMANPSGGNISLAYSLPSADMFPLDDFRKCVDRVMRREGRSLLQLGRSSGYEPLREHLSVQMALMGVKAEPEEILITNGCQQSLDLIRQILVGPDDEVALENPTYPGALGIFCGPASKYVSVPVTEQGMDLDVLEDILSQRRPKLIYTIPSFHNPTGATMGMQARRRLIELAIRHRVPIVEDDIYGEMRYEGAMLPPLKALDEYGIVIYINSFSKVSFPGLRVGWVVAPRMVIDHLNRAKERSDLHASLMTQAAIHEFSRHGLLARHIKRVKRAYAERRDCMLGALEGHFPDEARWNMPEGGMAFWVELPEHLSASQVLLQAAEQGVIFSPGEAFYCSLPRQNMMRLSFTMASPPLIEEAIKRLGRVIEARMSSLKKQKGLHRAEAYRALV